MKDPILFQLKHRKIGIFFHSDFFHFPAFSKDLVPNNYFQGVYKVPKNFQGVYKVPKNYFQGVYKIPKIFQGL